MPVRAHVEVAVLGEERDDRAERDEHDGGGPVPSEAAAGECRGEVGEADEQRRPEEAQRTGADGELQHERAEQEG